MLGAAQRHQIVAPDQRRVDRIERLAKHRLGHQPVQLGPILTMHSKAPGSARRGRRRRLRRLSAPKPSRSSRSSAVSTILFLSSSRIQLPFPRQKLNGIKLPEAMRESHYGNGSGTPANEWGCDGKPRRRSAPRRAQREQVTLGALEEVIGLHIGLANGAVVQQFRSIWITSS